MARQEKAVDPLAGPLQAFASELRKVRVDAGSPTYRTLAKAAGYSAATLSEAAGGVSRPTLDVVLAYVGACRGDVELWRTRWHELQSALAPAPASDLSSAPASDLSPAPVSDLSSAPVSDLFPGSAEDPRPAPAGTEAALEPPPRVDPGRSSRPATRWRWNVAAFVAAAIVLAGTAGAFAIRKPGAPAKPGCPRSAGHVVFTAVTYDAGARVHTGAIRAAPVTETIPSGCTVGFVGFCLGEKIHDSTGGSPDVRWFKLPDGDVLASAIVHGNPPPGLTASRCADDRPAPSAIALTVTTDPAAPDTMRLAAVGTHLDIVGFAALYDPDPAVPAERGWQQVGSAEETADHPGFAIPWKIDRAVVAAGPGPVLIAAAACLGGDGPTGIVAARTAGTGRLGPNFPPVSLTAPQRIAAAKAACSYPG